MISEQLAFFLFPNSWALRSTSGFGIVHICHECCKPQNENILNQIIGRTLQKRPKLFRKYCKAESKSIPRKELHKPLKPRKTPSLSLSSKPWPSISSVSIIETIDSASTTAVDTISAGLVAPQFVLIIQTMTILFLHFQCLYHRSHLYSFFPQPDLLILSLQGQ